MRRVFHIITRLDIGGAERVAINIAKGRDNDVEQHIVELIRAKSKFTTGIKQELDKEGILYHRALLPVVVEWHYVMQKMIAVLFPLRLLFLWLRYHPEIIHVHTEMPEMALWLSMKTMPFIEVRVVRTIHNTQLWGGMEKTGRRVERFMQRHNANIAISENVRNAYTDKYGGNPIIIHNGVGKAPQREYPGIIKGKKNICFAGRFEKQKGIDILCKIIRRTKDDSRYHFHIFGNGRLQETIDNLRNLPNVSINKPINGIASILGSFDYVIMPSEHEGLSIFALEASFNGAPLLINRCAGLQDTLPKDWPLAVNHNDIEQWTEIFSTTLPSIDNEVLKAKAFEYVEERFSIEKMQKEYLKIYKNIIIKPDEQ